MSVDKVRRDVDRGWAWVVMASACLVNLCVTMLTYSLGIEQVILLEVFEGQLLKITWIQSITLSLVNGTGPLAGYLSKVLGCRTTMLLGCCLVNVGLVSTAFITDINQMFLTLSLVTGLGGGVLFIPSVIVLGYYFEKHLALAMSVASTGAGIGMCIGAPYVNSMQQNFGWRGMFIMLSCVCVQCFIWAAMSRSNSVEKQFLSLRKCKAPTKPEARQNNYSLETEANSVKDSRSLSPSNREKTTESSAENLSLARRFDQESSTYGSIKTEAIPGREESINIKANQLDSVEPIKQSSNMYQFRKDISAICGCSMLAYYTAILLWSLGMMAVQVHLQNFVVVKGLSQDQSALLSLAIGIGNMISRFMSGILISFGHVDKFLIFFVSVFVMSVTAFAFPYVETTFAVSLTYSALFGLSVGGPFAILPTMAKDLVGLGHLAMAFGIGMLMVGIGGLFGPPLAGVLYASTGDYSWTFIFAGSLSAGSSILAFVLLRFRKRYMYTPLEEDIPRPPNA